MRKLKSKEIYLNKDLSWQLLVVELKLKIVSRDYFVLHHGIYFCLLLGYFFCTNPHFLILVHLSPIPIFHTCSHICSFTHISYAYGRMSGKYSQAEKRVK